MSSAYGPKDKIWIIKSSAQLLGPYSREEIHSLILDRQVVPIDEIAPPFGNWSFVRDLEIFREELLQANTSKSGDDDTKTMSSMTQSVTDQLTSTSLENTDELTSAGVADRTNPIPDVQPINTNQLPKRNQKMQPASKSSFSFKGFVFSIMLFLGLVAAGHYGYKYYLQSQNPGLSFEDSLVSGQRDYAKGNFGSAYKHFQNLINADQSSRLPKGFYVQMATLVLNQERQTVYARDLLGRARDGVKTSPEWLTAQGLSYLIDQNYRQAEKLFLKSIQKNPQFLAAWVNVGHLYLIQDKYQEAWDFFYGAYVRGYKEGHIPLFMALTLIDQWRISSDPELLMRAKDLLESFLETNVDHKDYLNIMSIWLSYKLSQGSELNQKVDEFIQNDPYSYRQIKMNPYEYVYDSKKLEPFCADVFKNISHSKLSSLLYSSLCYQRLGFIGDIVEAPIRKASENYSSEPLVFGAQAIVLSQMGEQYQKSLLIGRALSTDSKSKYILPLILQAHFCEDKGDLSCAYKYWKRVNDKDKLEIGAYAGIAKYLISKDKSNEAKRWVNVGLLLAPSHKPLIELRMKLM